MKQLFYVNDLGAQIGLTALGYSRVYDKLKPMLKVDQWIGTLLTQLDFIRLLMFVCRYDVCHDEHL